MDSKKAQIILRTTADEKQRITDIAKENGVSINTFIKDKVLTSNDSKNDIDSDIVKILQEQLAIKDEQIINLQKIIFNRDTLLLETQKKWWHFWK